MPPPPCWHSTGCGNCNLSAWRSSQRIGLQLGADVPFFLGGHNAWVEGIGEKITPVDAAAQPTLLVVKPDAGLDTRVIFSDPALKRDQYACYNFRLCCKPRYQAFRVGRNDLQPLPRGFAPVSPKPSTGLQRQGLAWPDDRLWKCGVCADLPRHACSGIGAGPSLQVRQCSSLDVHPLVGWAASDNELVGWAAVSAVDLCRGVAKLVKALDFDSSMRRFESFLPCQIVVRAVRQHCAHVTT